MPVVAAGDSVWYDALTGEEFVLPTGAVVKAADAGQIQLTLATGEELWVPADECDSKIRLMHASSVEGVNDMIGLGDMDEGAILHNLFMRYGYEKPDRSDMVIYTYTGSILVAVNPYCLVPGLYTAETIDSYKGMKIGEMDPHVFAISDNAYYYMRRDSKNQCCVISGESGAGKTETTKLLLQFLAAASGQHSWIEQQILEANPILEAFGNAKTLRNDNSSRFGKYIDVHFDKSGAIKGAMVEQYLLEKARIVHQMVGERNYHIFYFLNKGGSPELLKRCKLTGNCQDYHMIAMGECIELKGMDDVKEWEIVLASMKVLNFPQDRIDAIFDLTAACLHLGAIEYEGTETDGSPSSEIADEGPAQTAAELIKCDFDTMSDGLVTRSIVTRGEVTIKPLSSEKAEDTTKAFAKGIYGRFFIDIVDFITEILFVAKETDSEFRTSVGVLDIFGFENFDFNSFEQLCINYCNEALQQFFVHAIFKMEQQEYDKEKINWANISFTDNAPTLALIAEMPMNVLAVIDEETKFPKATDDSMLEKLHNNHGKTKDIYIQPKSSSTKKFGINHFAGAVHYDSEGFLERNRDTFSQDLINAIGESENDYLKGLFEAEIEAGTESKKKSKTLGWQFKSSLDALMKTLGACNPWFVRCVKPNHNKNPGEFDRDLCTRQLRYSGMMETIRIRKAGYPIRHTYAEAITRYRLLANEIPPPGSPKDKENSIALFTKVLGEPSTEAGGWQVGASKLFIKDSHDALLEEKRDDVFHSNALSIQRLFRGALARKRFIDMKSSMTNIQTRFRSFAAAERGRKLLSGFSRLQSTAKMSKHTTDFRHARSAVSAIQQYAKGFLARDRFKAIAGSVEKIQSVFKFILARRAIRAAKDEWEAEEAKEEAMKAGLDAEEAERQKQEKLAELAAQTEAEKDAATEAAQNKADAEDGFGGEDFDGDDGAMVDQMFGFVEDEEGAEGGETNAFGFDGGEIEGVDEADADAFGDSRVRPEDDEDNIMNFKFSKFAGTYFQGNANAYYIRRAIKSPLLNIKGSADKQAAISVWVTVLRFMGDMPEPKYTGGDGGPQTSVMGKMYKTLGRKSSKANIDFTKGDEPAAPVEKPKEKMSIKKKLISMTLRKKNKMSAEMAAQFAAEKEQAAKDEAAASMGGSAEEAVMPLQNKPTTNLEKLHYIIGHGILRPALRDEIYCQICKQLTQNPSKSSHARGWILLSLCIGCFAPSETFANYLRCFILEGPPGYAPYCEERLNRTLLNGTRHQPPSWLELQATKSKKPLMLPITFMDGNTKTLLADSATTASELCNQLSEKIKLRDRFGFSLYVALFDKVSSLGSGSDHVMDAISQCEQYAKEQGAQERNAPWRLFFRKEIFAPWHNPSDDTVGNDLIYQQVVRGIKFGEYRCEGDDLARIAAMQYYVDHGPDMEEDRLLRLVPSYIPDAALAAKSAADWGALIEKFHAKGEFTKKGFPSGKVKEDVVTFAKDQWPLLFSRFYEAYKFSGPSLPKNDVIIAVNWSGVYVVDDQENVLLACSYPEITTVSSNKTSMVAGQSFCITTVKGDEYTFTSTNGEDIRDLVLGFLEGLRRKSKFVVAMMDYQSPEADSNFLSFQKGDLIELEADDGYSVMHSGWCFGKCTRSGDEGDFPANCVYVLPAIVRPAKEVLQLFQDSTDAGSEAVLSQVDAGREQGEQGGKVEKYSIEEFAMDHFRPPSKKSSSMTLGRRSKGKTKNPWGHGRDALKTALLKKIVANEDLNTKAVAIYLSILRYMGDAPHKKQRFSTDLSDTIIEHCLSHDALRDEVYCQLMKQLTDTKSRQAEERGWELFWLCTGCFACSSTLLPEIKKFLAYKAQTNSIATTCLNRLAKTQRNGQRKYPPHLVELEAIQNKKISIYHKVYFPDDTDQAFEVESSTRAKDFAGMIGDRLGLVNVVGMSLFVKIADKVISVPDGDFFFDFVRHLTEWLKKTKGTPGGKGKDAAPANLTYQVFFMKKIWSETVIGEDESADAIFHYHQELPKLLRGYHNCSMEEATNLAGLVYRVKFGEDKSQFGQISSMLDDLVPCDLKPQKSGEEWKKGVVQAFNKHSGKGALEAKGLFLKVIQRWPTFGSAFFEVVQKTEPKFPQKITIAINKAGVSFINPADKEILATHPFSKISNWSSGGSYFNMAIGNLVRGSKILCETNLGYKMDDLLTSYISQMLVSMNKKKARAM